MYVDSSGTTIKSFFEETFGWGLIIGSQTYIYGTEHRWGGSEMGFYVMKETGSFDKPICFYFDIDENWNLCGGIQLNIDGSPYGITFTGDKTQSKLSLVIENFEGSIFVEGDRLGIQISRRKQDKNGAEVGGYNKYYIKPNRIIKDVAIAAIVVKATIDVGKILLAGTGALVAVVA